MEAEIGPSAATTVGGIHIGNCSESAEANYRNAIVSKTRTHVRDSLTGTPGVRTSRKMRCLRGTGVGRGLGRVSSWVQEQNPWWGSRVEALIS